MKQRIPRPVKITIALLYFAVLSYLVFFSNRRRHRIIRNLNLLPMRSTIYQYHEMSHFRFWYDFFGNIAVFLPVCFAVKFLFPAARYTRIIVFGCLMSVCIEALQYIFEVGYTEIDDVILNTLGTILGVQLYKYMLKELAKRRSKNLIKR